MRREEGAQGGKGGERSGTHGSVYLTAQCSHTSLVCLSFPYQLPSACMGIHRTLVFLVWVSTLRMIFSSPAHLAANIVMSFLLTAEQYSTV